MPGRTDEAPARVGDADESRTGAAPACIYIGSAIELLIDGSPPEVDAFDLARRLFAETIREHEARAKSGL